MRSNCEFSMEIYTEFEFLKGNMKWQHWLHDCPSKYVATTNWNYYLWHHWVYYIWYLNHNIFLPKICLLQSCRCGWQRGGCVLILIFEHNICFYLSIQVKYFFLADVVHNVVVVAGGVAKLPCEINQNNPEDRTKLVLWFHHQSLKPFYT